MLRRRAILFFLCLATGAMAEVRLAPDLAARVDAFRLAYSVDVAVADEASRDSYARYALPAAGDTAHCQHIISVVLTEFSRYPKTFVTTTGLRHVRIARNLTVESQSRAAVILDDRATLVIDADTPDDRRYLRHSIHHEYWHLIESNIAGDFYFKDPKWSALNPRDSEYGKGGKFDQDSNTDPANLNHPRPGFVDHYATSGLEEDQAEVFACLMLPEESTLLNRWSPADPSLAAKVRYMRQFMTWCASPKTSPSRNLFAALLQDDRSTVDTLLKSDPSLAAQPAFGGWRPLQWAAAHAASKSITLLAEHAPINDPDEQGWTPLHIAAAIGDPVMAHQLINLGADRSLKDKSGQTPADRAAEAHHAVLAKLLSP